MDVSVWQDTRHTGSSLHAWSQVPKNARLQLAVQARGVHLLHLR